MSRLARGRPARSALPDKSGVPSRITRLEAARFARTPVFTRLEIIFPESLTNLKRPASAGEGAGARPCLQDQPQQV